MDGTVVRFGDNACVLVNKSGDPIGTRMNGMQRDPSWERQILYSKGQAEWNANFICFFV